MKRMTVEDLKGFHRTELRVLAAETGTTLTEPFLEAVALQLASKSYILDALTDKPNR